MYLLLLMFFMSLYDFELLSGVLSFQLKYSL